MELSVLQNVLLYALILLVLVLPLSVHKVEENLEAFLFCCGAFAVTVTNSWSWHLIKTALEDPITITVAVFIAGLLFKFSHKLLQTLTHKTVALIGLRATMALTVFLLGMTSSLITAIIAALILSEVVLLLPLQRKTRIQLVVYCCYAIGMGAVLTSIGEPLGTIVLSKLKGEPHNAGFWFLVQHLGWYVLAGNVLLAALAARIKYDDKKETEEVKEEVSVTEHGIKNIFVRAAKVYLFVMALVMLGDGLKPLAEKTISHLSANALYFINMLSAILDNATLAAIEITPDISMHNLMFLLMSLIISGGMLIPGNIPNIICASKLKIKSKEWAKAALPLGAVLMVGYFIVLTAIL